MKAQEVKANSASPNTNGLTAVVAGFRMKKSLKLELESQDRRWFHIHRKMQENVTRQVTLGQIKVKNQEQVVFEHTLDPDIKFAFIRNLLISRVSLQKIVTVVMYVLTIPSIAS